MRPAILLMIGVGVVIAVAGFLITSTVEGPGGISQDEALDLAEDVSGGDADEGDSLYVAENLEPALAEVRDGAGGDARVQLKIEQRSLKLQAQQPGGQTVSLVVGAQGQVIKTPLGGFEVDGPPVSQIDPVAVERIARQVTEQAGISLQDIDYITTLPGQDVPTWGIYLDDGRRWESNLDGSNLRQTA